MIRLTQCPICGSDTLKILVKRKFFFPGEETKENLADLKYVRLWILFEKILKDRRPVAFDSTLCTSCGFIFTNPRFAGEEMAIKYNTINELSSVKKRFDKHPPTNLDARAQRIHSLITGLLERERERESNSLRILDYGGASGYNLIPFIERENSCYILDYEKWDLPKGIEYLGRNLADLKSDVLFDVILLCHTLEHVPDPVQMVGELINHLAESGLLYVEVPLGAFREYRHYSEPLTHVNFFSEESLFNCCSSANLGIIHISTRYQWLIHGNEWCVNIICKKAKSKSLATPGYLTTHQQMNSLYYYLPLIKNKIRRLLK